MSKKIINSFLEDMTYNSSFKMLEEGQSADELKQVMEKCNLAYPSPDLAVFKCTYAYIDRQNLNGCTLRREDVEKSLATLNGKAVDFDHFRKRVVGHWLYGEIQENAIVAYGVFYKSNFAEDYETIERLFKDGVLAISFEAWGERVGKEKDYDLKDICFAGGALLLKTSPAFPGSQVMEMAKERVMEFAKVMTKPDAFLHEGKKKEFARLYLSDIDTIYKLISEIDCPICGAKGWLDVLNMDYENSQASMLCVSCNSKLTSTFTPKAEIAEHQTPITIRSIKTASELAVFEDIVAFIRGFAGSDSELELKLASEFSEMQEIENSARLKAENRKDLSDDEYALIIAQESKKIRMLPIHNKTHIASALSCLAQKKVQGALQKLGVSIDTVKGKILKKEKALNMDELLKKYQKATVEEILAELYKTEAKREATIEETAALKQQFDTLSQTTEEVIVAMVKDAVIIANKKMEEAANVQMKADFEKTSAELTTARTRITELESEISKISSELASFRKEKEDMEKAKIAEALKSRRDELGDFASEMKDEDLLDDVKFELAKLRKENAELKAGKVTKPIVKGSADKHQDSEVASRTKIDSMAFNAGNR